VPVTMAEILQIAMRRASTSIRVALPGRVTRVKDTGRVDVRVELRVARPIPDETYAYDDVPELVDVPVLWQSTQAAAIVMKLAPGDAGLVIFADHQLGAWLTAGQTVNPVVPDAHGYSGAVFSPGLWPTPEAPAPVTGADIVVTGGDIRLGSASASDPVALKSDLQTLLQAITNAVPATPPAPDGGAALQASLVSLLTTAGFPVGSQKVKSE
jgi:hypothetical protein